MELGGVRTLNTSLSVGTYIPFIFILLLKEPISSSKSSHFPHSLEKEPPRRASPWRMLEHPWMVEMKAKKVNMEHFLKQVWDWKD